MKEGKIMDKKSTEIALKAISQEINKRTEDIINDLERVASITINAVIRPDEWVNFDITKNYLATYKEKEE